MSSALRCLPPAETRKFTLTKLPSSTSRDFHGDRADHRFSVDANVRAFLPPSQVPNVGIGPFIGMKPDSKLGFVRPTKTFADTLEAEAAGIKFKLIFAPGETDDQIIVWLPEQETLIASDNFYWAFPNLYTIRGTSFRNLKQWYQSVDKMRDLNPAYLVPCHTRPIIGAQKIQEILTNYRDTIQYVHDQSIRGINAGLTPDELAEHIKLPAHLS